MRVEPRWKDKKGKLLPEEGRESERDMRVDVVHYSALEEVALEACSIETHPSQTWGFSIAGERVALVAEQVYGYNNPFSIALEMARMGMSIQRAGWNGSDLIVRAQFPDEHSKMTEPYLYMEYPDGRKCPWAPTQTDVMATDWRVL